MKVHCPQCGRRYTPDLEPIQKGDTRLIQHIYPDATPMQREQLKLGICSDRCWDLYLGHDSEETVYDESGAWLKGGYREGI